MITPMIINSNYGDFICDQCIYYQVYIFALQVCMFYTYKVSLHSVPYVKQNAIYRVVKNGPHCRHSIGNSIKMPKVVSFCVYIFVYICLPIQRCSTFVVQTQHNIRTLSGDHKKVFTFITKSTKNVQLAFCFLYVNSTINFLQNSAV